MGSDITRREALRRAAFLLGGTLSAPTILGVLSGCRADTATVWVPRTLTPHQHDTIVAIAEIIIPTTDTPGAREAGVGRFVDAMFSQYYPPIDRLRLLDGLDAVDAQAKKQHGKQFTELSTEQQTSMVSAMDRVAFRQLPGEAGRPFRPELLPAEARKTDVPVGTGDEGADRRRVLHIGSRTNARATPHPVGTLPRHPIQARHSRLGLTSSPSFKSGAC